jgi:hypothetical protein
MAVDDVADARPPVADHGVTALAELLAQLEVASTGGVRLATRAQPLLLA